MVVARAGRPVEPQCARPKRFIEDHARFGAVDATVAPPDETVAMVIVKRNAALLALLGGAGGGSVAANRAAR